MSTHRNEVAKKIVAIISEVLSVPESEINEHTLIVEDLKADSMDIVTLGISVDDEFKIELDLADLPPERVAVGWIVDYICAKLA